MPASNNTTEKTEAKKANKTTETTPNTPPAPQKSGSGMATFMATLAFGLSAAAGYGIYWTSEQAKAEKQVAATQLQSAISSLQSELTSQLKQTQQAAQQTEAALKKSMMDNEAALKSELDAKAKTIADLSQQIESTTTEKISAAESNLTSAQAELGKAHHDIKETQKRQQSLEVSIDGLYSRIGNTSREWVIAEADYLLKIANHRLQLEQDVTTSIQALTLADKRLNSLSEPALNEVRNVIAQELISLETLPIPDQAGVAMQLSKLQDQVDQLPLTARTQPVHKDSPEFQADDAMTVENWQKLPLAILDILKGMVSVNYNDKPIEPLLSPTQVKNLHENLKLKLEQARIVLLRGDQKLYDTNMDLALAWTNKHFNTEEVSTKKFVDTINYLKSKQVVLKVPDISSSLRTLRKVAKRLEMNIPNVGDASQTNSSSNVAMN